MSSDLTDMHFWDLELKQQRLSQSWLVYNGHVVAENTTNVLVLSSFTDLSLMCVMVTIVVLH